MANSNYAKIPVDVNDFTMLAASVTDLSRSLEGRLKDSIDCILNEDSRLTPEQNAMSWLTDNYDTFLSSLRMITLASDFLWSALINDAITITPSEPKAE